LLGLFVIGLIYLNCRRMVVGLLTICAIVLLVAVNLSPHWHASPELASYVLFAVMLYCLQTVFGQWSDRWRLPISWTRPSLVSIPYATGDMRRLWLLPVIFLIWANTHGGFLVGLLGLAIYLICRSLEALCTQGRVARPLVLRFGIIIIASFSATLVNPFGLQLHQRLFEAGSIPWPEFSAWHQPNLTSATNIGLMVLVLTWIFALSFTRQSRDFTGLVLSTAAAIAALEYSFFVPIFAIAVGFFIPVHVESVCRLLRVSTNSTSDVTQSMHRWVVVTVTIVLIAMLTIRLGLRPWRVQVNMNDYPVSAARYIEQHGLSGKMIVAFNWSPFILGTFGEPNRILVGLDRRFRNCYPQSIIDHHFDFFSGRMSHLRYRCTNSPRFNPNGVLELGDPDLVLLQRNERHSVRTMNRNRHNWTLLYQDGLAQLWGRSARFGDPDSPDYVPPTKRQISNSPQFGSVTWEQTRRG